MFLISGVCLSKFSLVNYRREIIGVCLSDLKLVIDFESSIRGMFFQFDISEILGVYEDVGYVFLGVYLSLCRTPGTGYGGQNRLIMTTRLLRKG